MILRTASTCLSNIDMRVIYYSRGSLIPALMAAISHCWPAISLADAISHARGYLSGVLTDHDGVHFVRYGAAAGREVVYAASAAAPSNLVERTLTDFIDITGSGTVRSIVASGLPPFCRNLLRRCRHDHSAQWRETAALVEQLKLRLRAGSYRCRL